MPGRIARVSCARCRAPLGAPAASCGSCGERLLRDCPGCGEEMPASASACVGCERISPTPWARVALAAGIRRRAGLAWTLFAFGLGLMLLAFALSWARLALCGAGTLGQVAGVCLLAQAKGRGGAWGLLGLLSLAGMVVVILIPGRCLHCGAVVTLRAAECAECSSPVLAL